MEILHVSFSRSGGAGRVAAVLHKTQNSMNLHASIITVLDKDLRREPLKHPKTTVLALLDVLVVANKSHDSLLSLCRSVGGMLVLDSRAAHSVIHLHWVEGALDRGDIHNLLEKNFPIVWTLHDMAPFTGACHHSHECRQYEESCTNCPQARKAFRKKVSLNLERKVLRKTYDNLVLVAPTTWLANRAKSSRVFKNQDVFVIPNPIDRVFFSPYSYPESQNGTGKRPGHRFDIAAVASDLSDLNKGIAILVTKFKTIQQEFPSLPMSLKLIGRGGRRFHRPDDGVLWLGELSPERLAEVADRSHALVSLSQAESAGLIVREFGARGTPTIALNRGGIGEMVRDGFSGILFEEMSQLDSKLGFAIRNQSFMEQLGIHAKVLAEENKPEVVAARYSKLYETLSEKRRGESSAH